MANSNGWGDGASNNNIGWGKGADNAIGWGSIYANSWAGATDIVGTPAVDPDAQAFITAAAITDPTQQAAINTLVVDLKGYNVWAKMQAIYPMVGGTAATHKWNLKDPRDLDAAFRLVFNGGGTWDNNGYTPNGTNGYADTFYNVNTNLSDINSNHLSFYSRTNVQGGHEMGASQGGGTPILNAALNFTGLSGTNVFNMNAFITHTQTDSRYFMINSRTTSTLFKVYKNGTTLLSSSTAAGSTKPNLKISIGNLTGYNLWSNKQCAFASIGTGLTDTEAANFYTAVQAFQTTLGRSIGTQTVSDADAQAFVTNAGIVDQVEANAVNNLVIGMKADGTWSKMKAVYPMVGGSSSTMKYNLKNPLDTDAAFRLVFNGGWTFSSNGALPNGTNAYADTKLNLNTMNSINDISFGYYSRTNSISNGSFGWASLSPPVEFYIRYTGNVKYGYLFDAANDGGAATDCRGLNSMSRTASNQKYIQINNTIASYSSASSGSLSSKIFQFALGSQTYENRENAFSFIGNGLTNTELTNLNTRVTTFQTALNRNV